ncbi:hypothetical protein MPSEU_000690200 [Mayamaea pseudoterrestris]|nr:hypothetical protein MPSEU_000690200 [Mayamaea pseudoterrestris]
MKILGLIGLELLLVLVMMLAWRLHGFSSLKSKVSLQLARPFLAQSSHHVQDKFVVNTLGATFWKRASIRCFSTATDSHLQQNDSPMPSLDDTFSSSAIITKDLNPSQVQAVTQASPSITRVIAGPGSGKTRVLTCRMAHLLQTASSRDRILGVTFTRKAAGEMQERLIKLVEHVVNDDEQSKKNGVLSQLLRDDKDTLLADEQPQDPAAAKVQAMLSRVTLGTFHSVCAKILRWNGQLLATLPSVRRELPRGVNIDGSFAVIDEAGQLRILKDALNVTGIDLEAHKLKPKPLLTAIADCRAKLSEGQNPFVTEERKPLPKVLQIAQQVLPVYREKLIGHNCLDFDDLIYFTKELLEEHRDVRERLHRFWPHILVDEFQDTSRSQMDIVKLLSTDSLFIVGDADQSIYSWRGAHVGSLYDFEDEYRHLHGGVQTIYLMENYRSTANIVQAAQKVISHAPGKDSSRSDKLRKNMKPKREAGALPRIVAMADDVSEAAFVTQTIKDGVTAGKYEPSHTAAVLYRTNAQSRALEEACVKANLPYVIVGSSTSFYKRHEIRDCLCFLRWLYNGRDRVAMLRALETPKRGIGDRAVQEFDSYCQEVEAFYEESRPGCAIPTPLDVLLSLTEIPENSLDANVPLPLSTISKRPYNLLKDFAIKLYKIHIMARTETLEKVLAAIIDDLALLPHLDKISNSFAEFEERKANVRELQQATSRYQGACLVKDVAEDGGFADSPLGTFLDDVALVTEVSDEEATEDRFVVKLMTIHASKGMEFDIVFVVGNEDGTFPTSQAIQEGDGSIVLEEEKRLCYVAMTRAKTELFLSWRKSVSTFTPAGIRTVSRDMSRFLNILVGNKKVGKNKDEPATREFTRTNNSRHQGAAYQPTRQFYSAADFKKKGAASFYAQNRKPVKPIPISQTRELSGTTSIYGSRRKASILPTSPPLSHSSPINDRPQIPNIVAKLPTSNQVFNPKSVEKTSRDLYVPDLVAHLPKNANAAPKQRIQENGAHAPIPKSRVVAPTHRHHENVLDKGAKLTHSRQASKKTARALSSTMFYPIGSQVVHQLLGKGTVLPPPPSADPMLVVVDFGNGRKQEFDAAGEDLLPG